jgi:hypothetical protein
MILLATLSLTTIAQAAEADLLPSLKSYVTQAVSQASLIPLERQLELKKIALFIRTKNAANEPAQITFICTHNSRRSHLSALWALTAAQYYDVKGLKVFSGGIEVTALNPRAAEAMKRAGFVVDQQPAEKNPVYLIKFSDKAEPYKGFSKVYNKDGNPTENYLAAMTCAHADKNCPIVEGSSFRVGIHYEDPKEFDGKPEESAKYDETCHLIAQEMFYLMSQVNP